MAQILPPSGLFIQARPDQNEGANNNNERYKLVKNVRVFS